MPTSYMSEREAMREGLLRVSRDSAMARQAFHESGFQLDD